MGAGVGGPVPDTGFAGASGGETRSPPRAGGRWQLVLPARARRTLARDRTAITFHGAVTQGTRLRSPRGGPGDAEGPPRIQPPSAPALRFPPAAAAPTGYPSCRSWRGSGRSRRATATRRASRRSPTPRSGRTSRPQLDYARAVQFYRHDVDWANWMILGDSLQVMASLARRENLAGKGPDDLAGRQRSQRAEDEGPRPRPGYPGASSVADGTLRAKKRRALGPLACDTLAGSQRSCGRAASCIRRRAVDNRGEESERVDENRHE